MLECKTINEAWFRTMTEIYEKGYQYEIQQGSFAGHIRYQLPMLALSIEYPWMDKLPIVPAGCPMPTDQEYIDNYFARYLMSDELSENETYTYGSRIHANAGRLIPAPVKPVFQSQFEFVVDLLKQSPMTNQAVIEIASPNDPIECWSKNNTYDPPCLRLIDFKVLPRDSEDPEVSFEVELSMSVYFRSWDCWSGLPSNLGALELMQELVCQEIGILQGPIFAYSSGAHIYDFQYDLMRAKLRR